MRTFRAQEVMWRRFCWSLSWRFHRNSSSSSRRFETTTTTSTVSSFSPGVYPILVTPFHDDKYETIDFESFQRCIKFMMSMKSLQGITICGVLGEADKLLDTERQQLIECARNTIDSSEDSLDDFHLCVGTSHTSTSATIQLSQMAQECGADSVMVAPNKQHSTSPSSILDLYERLSIECPTLPVVVQDHPTSTQVHLSIDTLVQLTNNNNIPTTVSCIKLESLPTIDRMHALYTHPNYNKTTILTGLNALYAGYDLEHTMWSGFMTGFSFPEVLVELYQCASNHNIERAHALYQKFLPLIVLEHYGGLAVRKEVYRKRGLIESAHIRHPGTSSLSRPMQQALVKALERAFPSSNMDLTKPLPPEIFQV